MSAAGTSNIGGLLELSLRKAASYQFSEADLPEMKTSVSETSDWYGKLLNNSFSKTITGANAQSGTAKFLHSFNPLNHIRNTGNAARNGNWGRALGHAGMGLMSVAMPGIGGTVGKLGAGVVGGVARRVGAQGVASAAGKFGVQSERFGNAFSNHKFNLLNSKKFNPINKLNPGKMRTTLNMGVSIGGFMGAERMANPTNKYNPTDIYNGGSY